MLRIDLGCGTKKPPGFIGVDRYPLAGVDVVADMNRILPFRDDSVDLLLASHSLEHVEKLLATIQEVYRICKHGTQLCIIAPYSEQKLNWANPYHKCVFNEHTPRFWTDHPDTPVDPEEYTHPHAYQWGLSKTDNSNPGIDIRLVRMEYFYFPRYAGLPSSEQRRLRQERTDVCEQIMYHLIVWKGDGEGGGRPFDDYVAEFQPYEPEYIPLLRNRGRGMLLQKSTTDVEEARVAIARLEVELESRAVDAPAATPSKRVEELTADLERHKTLLQELRLEHHQQCCSLSTALEESLDLRNHLLDAKASIVGAKGEIVQLIEAKVRAIQDRDQALAKEAILTSELAELRQLYAGDRAESEHPRTELISLRRDHGELQAREALLTSQLGAARQACAAEAQVSERLRPDLAGAKDEINELRAHTVRLTGEITRLHEHCAAQTEVVSRATIELHDTAAYNRILRDEAAGIGRELESARVDLRREAAGAAASQAEASSLMGQVRDLRANLESNDVLRAKLGLTRAELETVTALLGLQRQKEEALGSEVAAVRREAVAAAHEGERWKTLWGAAKRSLSALCAEARTPELAHMVRAGGFLIGRDSQHQGLPKRFVALREYCDGHFHAARACLVLSNDLSEVPYREYAIPFELDRLTSVSLAIRPLLPGFSGIVGIEIVSADSEILTQVCLQLAALHRDGITEFQLPAPLTGLKKNWLLRVFVKDVDAPVQVYELARGALLRGATQFFPCVLFQ